MCEKAFVAPYDDEAAIEAFGKSVDVITFEFENIPAETVRKLGQHAPVRPGWKCLEICQDRVKEKTFATGLGIETAPWREVRSALELAQAIQEIGAPAILKTNTLGYDGKGQVRIRPDTDPACAWAELGADVGVLEGFIDFTMEISVITARRPSGIMASFDVVENRHKDGILDVTIAPAKISEQFVRAVPGLPLGSTQRHSDAVMKNLIGHDADPWLHILANPDNKLHLYGKCEARPGRKMGHINRLFPKGSQPRGWAD